MSNNWEWGVDGYGRKHVCRTGCNKIVACLIPDESIYSLMELLDEQEASTRTSRTSNSPNAVLDAEYSTRVEGVLGSVRREAARIRKINKTKP